MSKMKSFENKIIFIYLLFFIGTIIFNIIGFSIISKYIIIVYISTYILLSILSLVVLYKKLKGRVNHIALYLIPVLLIIFSIKNLYMYIPFIGLIPLVFIFDIKIAERVIFSIYLIFNVMLFGVIFLFHDFGFTNTYDELKSPDGKSIIIREYHDEGALGYNYSTIIKKEYLGIIKRSRGVISGRETDKYKVKWIDNNTIEINNKKYKISPFTIKEV